MRIQQVDTLKGLGFRVCLGMGFTKWFFKAQKNLATSSSNPQVYLQFYGLHLVIKG